MTRRFRRHPSRRAIVAGVLLFFVAVRFGVEFFSRDPDDVTSVQLREGLYHVVRVVDGDTIMVRPMAVDDSANSRSDSRKIYVRLLGIDTPETVKPNHPVEPWGPEATQFTKEFLADGKATLRFDKRRVDDYNRLLAYVSVGERMLNIELVRAGLADVSTRPGDSQSIERKLLKAKQEAEEENRGIWSDR